jgi:hypothetical protein
MCREEWYASYGDLYNYNTFSDDGFSPPHFQLWESIPRLRGACFHSILNQREKLVPDSLLFCSVPTPFFFFFSFSLLKHPQHYVRLYSTGNKTDCGSPDCFYSSAHKHKTARTCYCSRVRDVPFFLKFLNSHICDHATPTLVPNLPPPDYI